MTDKTHGAPTASAGRACATPLQPPAVDRRPGPVLGVGGFPWLTSGRYVSTDNAYVQADRVTIAPQVAKPVWRKSTCARTRPCTPATCCSASTTSR